MNLIQNLILPGLFGIIFSTLMPLLPAPACYGVETEMQADDAKTLRLLLVPEKNSFEQRRRYKYITDYLSRKMEMNVTVEMMANYGEISVAFQQGRADAGFFGSFSYVLTHAKTGIEPIARPVWLDGTSTYRGYIFVRRDSGIENIKDMKNKSLVLVDKATTAGYIFQRFYFAYNGINSMEDYFSRISFARSHDAAAWAVYTGEADIGGAKNHIYDSLKEEYPDFKEQMMVLAESPEVPSNGLAVRKDLNPALKLRLKTLLLSLHETATGQQVLNNFGALKFIETSDSDYEVLYKMVKELGIDLHVYPDEPQPLLIDINKQ
jgi:phosphonate transport system substrate-binding protein